MTRDQFSREVGKMSEEDLEENFSTMLEYLDAKQIVRVTKSSLDSIDFEEIADLFAKEMGR